MLQSGAAVTRGSRQKATRSPLAGKLFDETGDRLAPSHSRKNGKRLRYYISRRLAKDRGRKHPDAWRLPADQVEGLLADLIGQHLTRPGAAAVMTVDLTAAELTDVSKKLRDQSNATERLALIERVQGGAPFSYGHIHYILTNPVYAGRIRHHAQVYPGQHEPLIESKIWDDIQEQLGFASAKGRTFTRRNRSGAKASVSPLAGRIFDQTGDRRTPGHSKTAKGRRLRYYVSHRLVRGSAPLDPSGWRLPAPELEEKVAALVGQHMTRPGFRADILHEATTDEIATIGDTLAPSKESENAATDGHSCTALELVERIDISPGEIRISMSAEHLAVRIGVDADRIAEDLLTFSSPFQHRKRGVETKLIIGGEVAETDETLLRNIARAHRYFDLVRSGKTFGEISEAKGVSKRRIQHLIEVAFLAPDIIRSVHEGKQPVGLTSEWLKRHAFSPIWAEQREQFAAF